MGFDDYLKILAKHDGSDLYLSTGAPPCAKLHGTLKPIDRTPLAPGEIKDIAWSIMDEEQRAEFDQELEMNLAYSIPKVGRFRINIFRQRNEISRSEEHTSELQSREKLVCRLLLEKKNVNHG